jgi:hypothetical protein
MAHPRLREWQYVGTRRDHAIIVGLKHGFNAQLEMRSRAFRHRRPAVRESIDFRPQLLGGEIA